MTPEAALTLLGDSPAEVLRAAGIRGTPLGHNCCPVSNWVRKKCRIPANHTVSVTVDLMIFFPAAPAAYYPLPLAVVAFVDAFDRKNYPDLEESR